MLEVKLVKMSEKQMVCGRVVAAGRGTWEPNKSTHEVATCSGAECYVHCLCRTPRRGPGRIPVTESAVPVVIPLACQGLTEGTKTKTNDQ
jgi:hypothetical protein